MAVTITNGQGKFDKFKTKCSHCGVELQYSRRDIRAHPRWKDGFIYCPNCKNPIGYNEEYLLKEETYNADQRKIDESVAKKYRTQVKVLRILRGVFVPCGFIFMLVVPFLLVILGAFYKPDFTYSFIWITLSFFFGLGLLIAAKIFKNMIISRIGLI